MKNRNRSYYVQNYHQKKHYPSSYHHKRRYKSPAINNNFFQGNLASNMNFGSNNQEISGYVKREIVIIDRDGNKQIAREKQFFNSGNKLGRIRIDENESEF